jgi:TRAP-type transport system periplasmic protein
MINTFSSKAIAALVTCTVAFMAPAEVAAKTFKVALGGNEGSSQYALATKFTEELSARTGGEYDTKLFMNSQLGSEQDTVNDASMGLLDFSVVAINNITPFSPTVGVFTLPYMIQSLDEAVKLTQSEAGDTLVKNTIRDAGVRIVGWTFSGFRVLTNSKKPVNNLDDLKELVIRVPKNEIMIDTYRAWGINPTPMAWSELFAALQQKVVDGQDLALIDIETTKLYEIQKYISKIHYNFLIEPMIMSESIFQDQPKEVQEAILAAGNKATLYSANYLREQEAGAVESLLNKGMEITEIDEKEWIDKATTNVWPKYYDSVGGKDKINNVLRALGRDEI